MNPIEDLLVGIHRQDSRAVGRAISLVEEGNEKAGEILRALDENLIDAATVIGVTGPPGTGKSTLTDHLITLFRRQGRRIGVVAVDPSSPVHGGAILGDRIRMMKHATDRDVVIRSMATRGRLGGLCASTSAAVKIMACSGCCPILIETVGVGQAEIDIADLADVVVLVLAPGLGDDIQAMKAGLIEKADVLVVNKADCPGADALYAEMKASIRQEGRSICLTNAREGQGIIEVAGAVEAVDLRLRQSGRCENRRQKNLEWEVVGWALEMMRERIVRRMRESPGRTEKDPRTLACELVEELCRTSETKD